MAGVTGEFRVMLEQATGKSVLSCEWTRRRSRTDAQWPHRAHDPLKKSNAAFGAAFGAVRSSPSAFRLTVSSNRDFSQPASALPFYSTLVGARPSFSPGQYSQGP